MIILFVLLALIVFAAALFYLKYKLDNTSDTKNLESMLDMEVQKFTKNNVSFGLVIGVYKDRKSFIKAYGEVHGGVVFTLGAKSVFQIASVSKLLTASLLQILCDEGVLHMDATLAELIGDSTELSLAAQSVTLRQLVTHTSGFPSIPKSLEFKAKERAGKQNFMQNPYSHLEPSDVFAYLVHTKDKGKAGRFKYSNFGMGLLGHVLEAVMKKDFELLVVEKLLLPLDMNSTGISLNLMMNEHVVQGQTADGKKSPMWTFGALAGAGAFYSNAEDMMKFVRANIEGDSNLAKTFKKMHKPQVVGDIGIGWIQPAFLDKFFGNKTMVWHNGMVGGYASYISVDTNNKTGIVILSSKAVNATMLGMMLTRQVRLQSWLK